MSAKSQNKINNLIRNDTMYSKLPDNIMLVKSKSYLYYNQNQNKDAHYCYSFFNIIWEIPEQNLETTDKTIGN